MAAEQLPAESPSRRAVFAFDAITLASFAVLLMIVAVLAFWLGARRNFAPEENSPEVGFARDMMRHHAQAVDMATLLRDRAEDPEMRQLALDIMLTQQAQIGQIQGWLAVWNLPLASTEPVMAWMGMPTAGLMPGMATPEQLNALRAAQDLAADGLFLQLMIPHHQAGVAMAQAILERTQHPVVRNLAQSIINAQQSEIAYMQDLLEQKGLPAVETAPWSDHENMQP